MRLIRLSVLTLAATGGALYWFGRDEGLPDAVIGREAALEMPAFLTAEPPAGETGDAALNRALASDASPDTATDAAAPAPGLAAEPQPQPASTPPAPTPEQQVLAAAEPEPAPDPVPDLVPAAYLYVTGTKVNLRGGPSTAFGVLAALTRGTRVEDLGDASDGWRAVRLAETGETGYMAGRFLSTEAP